jgi:TDG/mug DNA glycosylase family protein
VTPTADGRRANAGRPDHRELEASRGRTVPDVVADGLRLLVCGINPGLWSGWSGHHFARPGNRFWPALHRAGLTPRVLDPAEEGLLPALGIGITNLVPRTTAAAAELGADELRRGARRLEALVARRRPGAVAVLGLGAYRTAFGRPRAGPGRQPEPLVGAPLWAVPNPSGLQARYGVDEIAALLAEAWEEGGRRAGAPR